MKNFKTAAITFFVLGLLDGAVVMMFPIQYSYQSMSFIPHFAFMFLLLFACDLDFFNRILCALAAGLACDLLFLQTFPVCMGLFLLLTLPLGLLDYWLSNKRIKYLAILALTFMLDFLPYAASFFLYPQAPTIHEWFYCMEILTLAGNGLVLFVLMEYWQAAQQAAARKRAKIRRRSIHVS